MPMSVRVSRMRDVYARYVALITPTVPVRDQLRMTFMTTRSRTGNFMPEKGAFEILSKELEQ